MAKDKAPAKSGKATAEPRHDPGWERAVESGVWDRPADALPDASDWPTWGALRERILMNAKEIRVTHTKTLHDSFPAEVMKLSPPNLTTMEFRGSPRLTRFVCSPASACPSLRAADLSHCGELRYALVQSDTLESLSFSKCAKLDKALLQCRSMSTLNLQKCASIKTLMIWSDALNELDLSACENLEKLELYCPSLAPEKVTMPVARARARAPETRYVPVAKLVLENMNARQETRRNAYATGVL